MCRYSEDRKVIFGTSVRDRGFIEQIYRMLNLGKDCRKTRWENIKLFMRSMSAFFLKNIKNELNKIKVY